MKKYTIAEREGLYLWCIGLLLEDSLDVVKTHPNHKPLSSLTKEEFAVENADIGAGIILGQLEEMGIDPEKLIDVTNNRFDYESEDLLDLVKLIKD